jgi:hypothetical protein
MTPPLSQLRSAVLALHKALIDAERHTYEQEFGPISPGGFLQVITRGTAYRWIDPLSQAILAIDEAIDTPDEAPSDAELVALIKHLLVLDGRDDDFGQRYAALVHAQPDILFAHSQVWRLLREPS